MSQIQVNPKFSISYSQLSAASKGRLNVKTHKGDILLDRTEVSKCAGMFDKPVSLSHVELNRSGIISVLKQLEIEDPALTQIKLEEAEKIEPIVQAVLSSLQARFDELSQNYSDLSKSIAEISDNNQNSFSDLSAAMTILRSDIVALQTKTAGLTFVNPEEPPVTKTK